MREVPVDVVPERGVLALGSDVYGPPAHDAPVIPARPVLVLEVLRRAETDHARRDGYVLDSVGAEHTLGKVERGGVVGDRSEEHTSELQSLMRISYAVFCLQHHNNPLTPTHHHHTHPNPQT